MKPKANRRWLQYGLRSLLALTLAVALLMAWWNQFRRPYGRQRTATDQLVKLGATVETKAKGPAWLALLLGKDYVEVERIAFDGMMFDPRFFRGPNAVKPDQLACLAKMLSVRRLDISEIPGALDDQTYETIGKIPRVEALVMDGTRVSHIGIARLKSIAGLSELSLRACHSIDDRACEALSSFQDLESLDLEFTPVTDDGMRALTRLPRLRELRLCFTGVSPKAASILVACPRLESLAFDCGQYQPGSIEFKNYPALKELAIGTSGSHWLHTYVDYTNLLVEDMPCLEKLEVWQRVNGSAVLQRLPQFTTCYLYDVGEKTVLADLPALQHFSTEKYRSQLEHQELWTNRVGHLRTLAASGAHFMNPPGEWLDSLEEVRLWSCSFRDCPARPLTRLSSLEFGPNDTPHGSLRDDMARNELLTALLQAPNMQDLSVSNVTLARSDLQLCTQLTNLSLKDVEICDADLGFLTAMPKAATVSLVRLPSLPVDSLQHLASLPALQSLYIDQPQWDDVAATYLASLPNTVALGLGQTGLSDEGRQQIYQTGRGKVPDPEE